ncbi:MAG: hypothetical protein H0V70_06140 [Ktedonobacteraceae bacterium]|nr:hypothetical protein [Ktedonobacteraceae bacterium]
MYQIRVKGHLDQQHWSNWLEGLTITHLENGETLLSGSLTDQAALYGVLHKLENQNVPLIEVRRVSPDEMPPSQ